MMRHSFDGVAMTGSTADAIFREPAFTKTARRPPKSGTVCASSTRRDGFPASSSPSMRTNVKGSLGSSTDARTRASTRSRTRPASGPNTSTTGRPLSGFEMKRSTSAALMAVICFSSLGATDVESSRSRASCEMRGQPVTDIFSDFLGGAILCVTQPALACEPLLLARNIVGYAGESGTLDDRLSGRNLSQGIRRVDAVIVDVGARRVDVDDDLEICCAQAHIQTVHWRSTACAAGEVVNQFVAHTHADTGKTAAARCVDCSDVDTA